MQLGGLYAVHLLKDGVLHSFLPGDDVPDWAAKQITNPHAWEAVEDDLVLPGFAAQPALEFVPSEDDPTGAPPKSGSGASRQAWADHAESKGVEVNPDWKREDIIAAVESAEN